MRLRTPSSLTLIMILMFIGLAAILATAIKPETAKWAAYGAGAIVVVSGMIMLYNRARIHSIRVPQRAS